jgi:hypothetical protein
MEIIMKAIWLWLTHYMVAIEWDGTKKIHWAKTEREAHAWMQCYSADALVMYGKRGRMIGARWMTE